MFSQKESKESRKVVDAFLGEIEIELQDGEYLCAFGETRVNEIWKYQKNHRTIWFIDSFLVGHGTRSIHTKDMITLSESLVNKLVSLQQRYE